MSNPFICNGDTGIRIHVFRIEGFEQRCSLIPEVCSQAANHDSRKVGVDAIRVANVFMHHGKSHKRLLYEMFLNLYRNTLRAKKSFCRSIQPFAKMTERRFIILTRKCKQFFVAKVIQNFLKI